MLKAQQRMNKQGGIQDNSDDNVSIKCAHPLPKAFHSLKTDQACWVVYKVNGHIQKYDKPAIHPRTAYEVIYSIQLKSFELN